MKKFLVFTLISLLTFGSLGFADIKKSPLPILASYEILSSGEVLKELNLIKGNNGDLNETGTLTRVELITIILRLKALDRITFVLPDTPSFSDVPKSHWAFRTVEIAKQFKITDGIGNGRFGTNDIVSYQQAVMFISRIMGINAEYSTVKEEMRAEGIYSESAFNSKVLQRGDFFNVLVQSFIVIDKTDDSYYFLDRLVEWGGVKKEALFEELVDMIYYVAITSNKDSLEIYENSYWVHKKDIYDPISDENYKFLIDYFNGQVKSEANNEVSRILQTFPLKYNLSDQDVNVTLMPFDQSTLVTKQSSLSETFTLVKCVSLGTSDDSIQSYLAIVRNAVDYDFYEDLWFHFTYDPLNKKVLKCIVTGRSGTVDVSK